MRCKQIFASKQVGERTNNFKGGESETSKFTVNNGEAILKKSLQTLGKFNHLFCESQYWNNSNIAVVEKLLTSGKLIILRVAVDQHAMIENQPV